MDSHVYDAVIIGAGMAGISAARNLHSKGITNIIIIEANDRIGGRLHTVPLKGNEDEKDKMAFIDLGGAWIHGSYGNPIYELMEKYDLKPCHIGLGACQIVLEIVSRLYWRSESNEWSDWVGDRDGDLREIEGNRIGDSVDRDEPKVSPLAHNDLQNLQYDPTFQIVLEITVNSGHFMYGSDGSSITHSKINENAGGFFEDTMHNINSKLRQMKKQGQSYDDMSLEQLWQECLPKDEMPPEYFDPSKMENHVLNYYKSMQEQYDAADSEELSAAYDDLIEDYPGGDTTIQGGYRMLINKMTEPLLSKIQLGLSVTRIETQKGKSVTIHCTKTPTDILSKKSTISGPDQMTFRAKTCLVTVPLGVLKKDTIQFNPPLPDPVKHAIQVTGMGLMNKVILQFPKVFWPTDAYAICYASPNKGENRWFYNCLNNTKTPTLSLLVSAKPAKKMEDMTDKEIVDSAMNVLRKIYGSDIPDPIASRVTKWGKNPFSYGSYSFHRVGATGKDFDAFQKIVDRVLWFAGEHTIKEYFGTVHGAYSSGQRAAEQIAVVLKQ